MAVATSAPASAPGRTTKKNGETLLRLEAVSKVFVTDEVETHALSGIELEIQRGEYISIAGPSGCGKSTLLSILGPTRPPTAATG
jgi:putative ABC transport system ATP-binding protein